MESGRNLLKSSYDVQSERKKCLQAGWMVFKNTTLKLSESMLLIKDFRKAKKEWREATMMR